MGIPRHNTWFWLPRRYPDTPNKNVFARENTLGIGEPGDGSAITGMDVVLTNTFAPVPVIGHKYASAQFIGPGQTQFQITVHNVGTETLTQIQRMAEETQQNAREFRRVKDCARVRFEQNAFLQLTGIEDAIVESVDSWTEPGTTDLYGLKITFTVDGQHIETLNQEMFSHSSLQWRVIERLAEHIGIRVRIENGTQNRGGVLRIPTNQEFDAQTQRNRAETDRAVARGLLRGGIPGGLLAFQTAAVRSTINSLSLAADPLIESVITQLEEEPNLRLSQETISLLRGDTRFRTYLRRALQSSGNESQSSGLGEAISQVVRVARDTSGEVVRTGQLTGTIRRILRNEIGQSVAIPSPAGVDVRERPSWTNDSPDDPAWFRTAIDDMIRILEEESRGLPLRSFFEGPWEGEYLRIRGNAFQSQMANFQQRIREAEARRRAADRDEQTFDEIPREGLRKGNQVARRGFERFVRTDLHNIPPFLRRLTFGTQRYFVRREDIARSIRTYLTRLLELGSQIIQEHSMTPDFDRLFPGLTQQFVSSRSLTVNPAYPDLDLPPHPVSRRKIDTEPDFYFWNDSEESMLNHIGPDLDMRLNRRLDRMLQSFHGIASGETWRQTYLGRSLYGPEGLDSRADYSLSGEPAAMEGTGHANSPMNVQVDTGTGVIQQLQRHLTGNPDSVVEANMVLSPSIMGSTEEESRGAVHNNRRSMMRNTVYNLQTDSTNPTMRVGPVDDTAARDEELSRISYLGHSATRNNIFNLAKQAILQNPDETLTMRRAFPTFKLYFIEDDTGPNREHLLPQNRTVAYFDDFYNYNSVKELRVVKSRKQPSHLMIATLTNVSGILDQRMWNHQRWNPDTATFVNVQRESYEPGLQETELENPLDHLILKQGLKVQLRLGYSNNAHRLPKEFNGEVVEIGYNHNSPDLITIVAQGYGAETVAERKGQTDQNYVGFADTADLLHSMMCAPEMVHFGRFDINPQFNPAEARSRVSSGTGRWVSPGAFMDRYRQHLIMARTKWVLGNNAADDNIFAPDPATYQTWSQELRRHYSEILSFYGRGHQIQADWSRRIGRRIPRLNPLRYYFQYLTPPIILDAITRKLAGALSPTGYIPLGSTIWEIFKEMELRHPGYVSDVRPYGTRMTMFFGIPDQRYWADEISREEMFYLRQWERQFRSIRNSIITRNQQRASANVQADINERARIMADPRSRMYLGGLSADVNYAVDYHAQQIYESDIAQSMMYLVDVARLQMPLNAMMGEVGEALGRTLGRFRPFRKYHIITSDHHILLNNIRSSDKNTFNAVHLTYADGKTYTLKADDNIPDNKLNMAYFNFPNCLDETMARRYCIGLLMRGLRDVYKGELVITGKNIDPWDAILLYDAYSDMYGPIEVEQVVHTFTRETGWITEITPDMCVHANEYSTSSTTNLMLDVATEIFSRYRTEAATAAAVAAVPAAVLGFGARGTALSAGLFGGVGLAAGAIAAGLGGYYFIRYTQERQPIWITPLILNNRPFTEGLYGFKQDGVFANIAGRLEAETNRLSEGWRAYHLAGYINDWTIGTARESAAQTGAAAQTALGGAFTTG